MGVGNMQKNAIAIIFFLINVFISTIIDAHALSARTPLRILFIVGFFPSSTEHFILNQIIGLLQRGHSVAIHACQGAQHEKLHPDITRYNLLASTTYGEPCICKLDEYDVIYAQFGVLGLKIMHEKMRQKSKTPLVTCFRGFDLTQRLHKSPHIYDNLLQYGDLFFTREQVICKNFNRAWCSRT
jgi:hypothetical protein